MDIVGEVGGDVRVMAREMLMATELDGERNDWKNIEGRRAVDNKAAGDSYILRGAYSAPRDFNT